MWMIVETKVFPNLLETNTNWYDVATVAIGNPERHVRKASHRGSKQQ